MRSDSEYNLIIGRHCLVKSPSFLPGAVREALNYDANALMVYLGAPQNSYRQPLSKLKISEFQSCLQKNNLNIDNVIVHGPYLINLGNTINRKIFEWSVEFLKKEIIRMEKVGLKTLIIHPGSSLDADPEASLSQIVTGLNLVLQASPNVKIALETMCQRKNEMGGNFEQLEYIINRVEQKERIGIC